jgi:hypothetical protein
MSKITVYSIHLGNNGFWILSEKENKIIIYYYDITIIRILSCLLDIDSINILQLLNNINISSQGNVVNIIIESI